MNMLNCKDLKENDLIQMKNNMNIIVWSMKSFYKMMIIILLLSIVNIQMIWLDDTLLFVGIVASVFSSIPYTKIK